MSKHPGGRPLKFQSVEELQQKIDEYFGSCDPHIEVHKIKVLHADGKYHWADEEYITEQRPYTITGLALALDCDRDTLLNYEAREEYFGTIKKAKLKIQNWTEEQLYVPKIATGVIFNLKNNYGWRDKSEIDHTTGGKPIYGGMSAGTVQGHNSNEDNISTD